MGKQQHTKGPWALGNPGDVDQPILAEGMDIGNVYAAECGPIEAEANARLIAAAPDAYALMLRLESELQRLRDGKRDGGTMGELSCLLDDVQAWLSKTTGGAE